MKRIVAFGLVGILLSSAAGCGGPDSQVERFVADLNAAADLMESDAPREKVERAISRANAAAERINKLKLSAGEQEALLARHDEELKAAVKRLADARSKWKGEGELPPIVIEKTGKK